MSIGDKIVLKDFEFVIKTSGTYEIIGRLGSELQLRRLNSNGKRLPVYECRNEVFVKSSDLKDNDTVILQ